MPQKTFAFERMSPEFRALMLPDDLTVKEALERVLRLLSVGSKRFLTNKVDRSVTGLIARQQCAGPLQLTVSDVAVMAQSHFGLTGAALAVGEQPIKGLIDPAAMARMSVAEAITNIVWAKISALEDIRCSGNWMWPAKLPGEGAALYDAAVAMRNIMLELGIAVDGGKDSLSMAAVVAKGESSEIVKGPGTLVISAYATCPDITKVMTPDIKRPGRSGLLLVDIGRGKYRLGGSALAHAYGQIGNESPDIEDPQLLRKSFNATQKLIENGLILSGHDISDGGLIVTLLEMAFSGNCGLEITVEHQPSDAIAFLFAEEAGLVMEYKPEDEEEIAGILKGEGVDYRIIGQTLSEKTVTVRFNDTVVLGEDMQHLRALWEETSYQLDKMQTDPDCVEEERKNIYDRKGPSFHLSFVPARTPQEIIDRSDKPRVAIIREEGSNGDREMTSAFYNSGFEVWDITMIDFLKGEISLEDFKGVAFVGGFSYADVLDSAKGWAGVIKFNQNIYEQFQRFYRRKDTFSLGVCNGCQLMALLGWIPWQGIENRFQPRFVQNRSGRFESRFATVRILRSPSLMLSDMEGSTLGIWVAHGEGRAYCPDRKIQERLLAEGLAPVRYVDDAGEITESYPFNPNGSPHGIAALCSPDGRHLAIMPHPERTFQSWQWAWIPEEWRNTLAASPWLRMFQNARKWCEGKK
ncbi:MAG: phosphoribosylformylglycinamidine synthase, partial [Thermodesulfovibrionales bacterium]